MRKTNVILTFIECNPDAQWCGDLNVPLGSKVGAICFFLGVCAGMQREGLVKVSMCVDSNDGETPEWYDECEGKLYSRDLGTTEHLP